MARPSDQPSSCSLRSNRPMKRLVLSLYLMGTVALVMSGARRVQAEQKYHLLGAPSAGDRYVFDAGMELGVTNTASADGRTLGQFKFENRHRERYTHELVSIGPKRPSACKRNYSRH